VWKGARYPGRHPKLVDDRTWARVQLVLEAHGPGEKQREHPHYLKSSVFCGDCGSRLIITKAKNRYGAIYPYFVCVGRHQKRTSCTRKALLISTVEELIEDFYADIQLTPELRQKVETMLTIELAATRAEAEAEQKDLLLQQSRLVGQRTKLLQAHYAGALPLDLLKTEQDRIASSLVNIETRLIGTQTRFDVIQTNLKIALDLTSDCHRAYLEADDQTRRMLNQALFEQIYLDEEGARARVAEPFGTLIGPDVMRAVGRVGESTKDSMSTQVGAATRPDMARRDWSAEYIRRIRGQRPTPTRPQTNKPSPRGGRGEGLKQSTLVRTRGLEPPRV
jgi:site-specific DNA recombinase